MRVRYAVFVLAIAAAALVPSSTVLADTGLSHSGVYGPHYLTDTGEFPGVACHYTPDFTLDRVRVRPPVIYAKDSHGNSRDAQTVGWQIIVRGRPAGGVGTWTTRSTSTIMKATAYDDQSASFLVKTVATFHFDVRIWIQMYWYQPGSSTAVAGWAKHRVDFYKDIFGSLDFCPAEHF